MRYAGIIKNDIAAGKGINLTFFTQGCPHHCYGCHNPETWDFDGGKEFTSDTLNEIIESMNKNGVQRNLSIMGGEPLCPENLFLTQLVIASVKERFPMVTVYIWTGYTYEELQARNETKLNHILEMADVLIDGRFELANRDVTLEMRGSPNQRIIKLHE